MFSSSPWSITNDNATFKPLSNSPEPEKVNWFPIEYSFPEVTAVPEYPAGYSGTAVTSGNEYSMGNQLTFSGSGELDNGLNVALSFVIDQGDDENNAETSPFDSHSVTISSDGLGTLVMAITRVPKPSELIVTE